MSPSRTSVVLDQPNAFLMLLPSFVKKLETVLVDFGFALAFALGAAVSGGGMEAVAPVTTVELFVVELAVVGAVVGAVVVPLVVELESVVPSTILGLGWAVPKTVAGAGGLAVGLGVATGVATGVGVSVPAGVRLAGELLVLVGA